MPTSHARVNLSVPPVVDRVLCGLSAHTGASKASLVMQALGAYLPTLRRRLAEFEQGAPLGEESTAQQGGNSRRPRPAPAPIPEVPLSRAERRRQEKAQRKALKSRSR